MYNWSIDIAKLKEYPKDALIWQLEQTINFGLNGDKLNKRLLKKHWKKLQIDPARRKFLRLLLWPAKY